MIQTRNPWFGFYGAMLAQGENADEAWRSAMTGIMSLTSCDEESVRDFLDSRLGRQFADTVHSHRACYMGLSQCIMKAVVEWHSYRTGKAICKAYGIPAGADYLTAMVMLTTC